MLQNNEIIFSMVQKSATEAPCSKLRGMRSLLDSAHKKGLSVLRKATQEHYISDLLHPTLQVADELFPNPFTSGCGRWGACRKRTVGLLRTFLDETLGHEVPDLVLEL